MQASNEERKLFLEERLNIRKLLANNPNYFGTVPGVKFPVVEPIKYNTTYEELTCIGLWPEQNLLEATIKVKLPFGFLGDLCTAGSYEYVRFFIDWDDDNNYDDLNEDLGVAAVNVHDIPQVKLHQLCYAVRLPFQPFLSECQNPYIVKLRAILSWEIPPPPDPNFIPIWGNVLECWVQIEPISGRILSIISAKETASDEKSGKGTPENDNDKDANPPQVEERLNFLDLLKQNPNYFGTLPISDLEPVNPNQSDTTYEELKCIGLYPEGDSLEAVLEVKLPYGFLGDLCTPGSYEYVSFFIDWDNDGDFSGFGENAGVAAVNVHDIPEVRMFHLCYALGREFQIRRATCQNPYIVKVRAILSWQQIPTGPDFIPIYGNVVECWVQIRPTEPVPPQLLGEIDAPVNDACVAPDFVSACAPLAGITITGTAGGAPFDHYTLRYSYSGNPPINLAVVYPDCSRPPANPSSNVPVINGTLGYLDVALLPPGVSEFTIYLDVYDAVSNVISRTGSFKLKTTAAEITAAATVQALDAPDPFFPGTTRKIIKATNNASTSVPEVSIGGAFSVTGSAYIVGCDRILSQYVLALFPAPPTSSVPIFPNASGATTNLIAPVVYADIPSHPWQSGCFPLSTLNIILNGDLVAFWSSENCVFLSFSYTVPKVLPVPFWDSSALNGRYVILLEVRDRLEAGGSFPGNVAAVDQVAVWIDNQPIQAQITSIGGLLACQDLFLSQFAGKTAEIRGVAWDPPIDSSAPQQMPNDNFGSYSLSFQKNGGGGGSIPAATPNTRVPNVWPILPPGTDGTLANWDIVGALDGGVGPLPPGSPKLARGERCAYVIQLSDSDTTHVGDSGSNHTNFALYAVNIINDIH